MNKIVIYTSIFGGYDTLYDISYFPPGCDFVCFTDTDILAAGWEIIKVPRLYIDNTRNAKRYKILPHKYLKKYDISIYIDGNFSIIGNPNELVDAYLANANAAFFDHSANALDPRNCIYQEASFIIDAGYRNYNIRSDRRELCFKDDPNIVQKQVDKYMRDGYPPNNGLISGGIILRRHNENDCINTMNSWWQEIEYFSKRDQLSFNYCAWKSNFNFNYIPYDIRNNGYFVHTGHTGKR